MHSYKKKKKIKDVSHTLSSRQKHIDMLFLQGNGLSFLDNPEPFIFLTIILHFLGPKSTSSQTRGSFPQVPTKFPGGSMLPHLMNTQHIFYIWHKLKKTLNSEKGYIPQCLLRKPETVGNSGNISHVKIPPLIKAHLGAPVLWNTKGRTGADFQGNLGPILEIFKHSSKV